ncbi:MAG: BrnA antitoxin family protein [Gammaproteobacteria bacterium]
MKRKFSLKPPKDSSTKVIDPDNPPWSDEMMGPPRFWYGRGPQKLPTKVSTTIRLDRDLYEFFRAQGAGYQTRINDTLRKAVEKQMRSQAAQRK